MEYIQTVLFQVPASRLEQASETGGLLAELDGHRAYLKQQPGFRDLRLTRSINNEGNVLIVVETRWADDESLVRYETAEPNVAGIIRKHEDLLVRDSLQVLDMEALRTEASFARLESAEAARSRLVLPLIVPLGVLAFALLAIYGLSRIYLELDKGSAVGLATGVAIGILLIAVYVANNPRMPAWQVGGIFVVVIAALAGGTIWALVQEDEGEATGEPTASASPGASPAGSPAAGGGELALTLGDNFFELAGQKSPTLSVAAGKEATVSLTNTGIAPHNMHVADAGGQYPEAFCNPGGATPCSDPNLIKAGGTATIKINLGAGTYDFRCDFHPLEMTGTLEVQ
ncbi:MAG: plastocyanin/azurin family copper-binding protein [Dehalococcoidia bacterium]|nr:plastocyanin/azurin family copper-binding protein [Dehalococcoidia bacterium]